MLCEKPGFSLHAKKTSDIITCVSLLQCWPLGPYVQREEVRSG